MRLAFLDHSYHIKTGCTAELIELFGRTCEVDVLYDSSSNGGTPIDYETVRAKRYDIVVCFQVLPPSGVLRALETNVVLIPMYDDVGGRPWRFWSQYADFRFVNFSKSLHEMVQRGGAHSLEVTYYPSLPPVAPTSSPVDPKKRVFWWCRSEQLDWRIVRKLLSPDEVAALIIKRAPDPGENPALPTADDAARFSVQYETWGEKADHLASLASCDAFIAPRMAEGIGMSFLEAMATGLCVIAPDKPTMNEYVTHGINGLLYDPHRLAPVSLSCSQRLGERARDDVARGRLFWLEDAARLVSYVTNPWMATCTQRLIGRLASALHSKLEVTVR